MIWPKRFFSLIKKHKIISLIVIVAIVGGGYYWYSSANKSTGKVSYVASPAQKGTIVVSISGSGQVLASNQVNLQSKVSENVVYVGVKNGQQVGAGTLLMEFDTTNTQKAVRNAQISLDNAKLSLGKVQFGNVTIPLTKQQAQDNLTKVYTDSFNTISNTFLDLPGIMTGLDDVLHGNELSKNTPNIEYYAGGAQPYTWQEADRLQAYKQSASAAYAKAKTAYDKNFDDYKAMTRSSDTTAIEAMLNETYNTTQEVSDAVKDAYNLIQLYEDIYTKYQMNINPVASTQQANLSTYTGKADNDLSSILTTQSTIKTDKDAITNADVNLQSQDLSVQGANISIMQAENALSDAKDNLANCYIYAPFSGIVANVVYNKGDVASSGVTAVTLITKQSITKIPFNEVDIAKIKVGQKATLAFDAISGLTVAGQVMGIDTLGTVAQGVVNYNVELAFDISGTQIKPGMSVTANVITDLKQDILMVPNSAVKTSGGTQYVQVLVSGLPVRKTVQTGLVNDTNTEITSGLAEGDNVVTQTITTAATTTATSPGTSSIRIPGLTGGGGGGGFGGGGGRGGN